MQSPFDESIKEVAAGMGISVYQQFSLTEASLFLRCPSNELEQLIKRNKIAFIQVSKNEVHFFGYQLLEHITKNIVPISERKNPQQFESNQDRIIRMDEVEKIVGLSRTTIWRMERKGEFPNRLPLTTRRVGWRKSEIESWLTNL